MGDFQKLGKQMVLSAYITMGAVGFSFLLEILVELSGMSGFNIEYLGLLLSGIVVLFQFLYLLKMTKLGFGQPRIKNVAILISISILAEFGFSIILVLVNSFDLWIELLGTILIPIPSVIGYFLFYRWINEKSKKILSQVVELNRVFEEEQLINYLKLELERLGRITIIGMSISYLGIISSGEFIVMLGSIIELFGILKLGKLIQGNYSTKQIISAHPEKFTNALPRVTKPFSIRSGTLPLYSLIMALYSLLWAMYYAAMVMRGEGFFNNELPIILFGQFLFIPFLATYAVVKINKFRNKPSFGFGIIIILTFSIFYYSEGLLSLFALGLSELAIYGGYFPLFIGAISLTILIKIREYDIRGSNLLIISTVSNGIQLVFGIWLMKAEENAYDVCLTIIFVMWIFCAIGYIPYFIHSIRSDLTKISDEFYDTRYQNKNIIRGILIMGVIISVCQLIASLYFQIFAGMDGSISISDPHYEIYSSLQPYREFITAISMSMELMIVLALLSIYIGYSQLASPFVFPNRDSNKTSLLQREIKKRSTRRIVGSILLILFIGKLVVYMDSSTIYLIADKFGIEDLPITKLLTIQYIQQGFHSASYIFASIGIVILLIKGYMIKRDYTELILAILLPVSLFFSEFLIQPGYGFIHNTGFLFPIISALLAGGLCINLLIQYKRDLSHNIADFQIPSLEKSEEFDIPIKNHDSDQAKKEIDFGK